MKKTYHGSCHCASQFERRDNLENGNIVGYKVNLAVTFVLEDGA